MIEGHTREKSAGLDRERETAYGVVVSCFHAVREEDSQSQADDAGALLLSLLAHHEGGKDHINNVV